MHFTSGYHEVSLINNQMPLQRIARSWIFDPRLKDGFYLFNALNHRDFSRYKEFTAFLIMPESLASGVPWDRSDTLLLRVSQSFAKGEHDSLSILLAEEVLMRENRSR